jgi:hypothetical protein
MLTIGSFKSKRGEMKNDKILIYSNQLAGANPLSRDRNFYWNSAGLRGRGCTNRSNQ